MSWLKKKVRRNSADLIVIVIFFLFSLRVITWFEYPYILFSGDFRPPLLHEAFLKRVLYTWDEIDLGMPSIYAPRILDPFYLFVTAFQTLSVSLYFSQIITVFLTYFFASILMYIYVKQITNGDIIAAFIAALFLTSNVHLIVDREIVAIGFLNLALMILPCLVTFTEGIKKKSSTMMAFSGLLFTLTYGGFPNYRVVLLCLIALALTLIFIYINSGVKVTYGKNGSSKFISTCFDLSLIRTYLKRLSIFILFLFLASIWVIVVILTNFDIFSMTYEQMAAPAFALYADYIKPHDVLRLIARWSFYETGLEKPYVPFADVYLHDPLIIILSYFPPILAFASLLASKSRKCTIYFSGLAALFLALTSAFSPYFIPIYLDLAAHLPLMRAFRESIHWIFFVILSYGILIGITLSAVCHRFRNKTLQILALSLTVALFLSTTYPLTTGDVARNWLDTSIKGSYFPTSYVEVNDMLPKEHWSIMVPQSYIYVIYNSTGSLWGCGNPYPLIFSQPVISGVGTEYAQSQNLELISELHERIRTGIICRNIAPEGKASASSKETDEFTPDKAIDGQTWTRWSSEIGVPQWFEIEWNTPRELLKINVSFEFAYEDYIIEAWNGSDWITLKSVQNNTSTQHEYLFSQPTPTTKLRLSFTKASPFDRVSIWELELYARTDGVSKFLGMLGIKYLVLEKNKIAGSAYSISDLELRECENFNLIREWDGVELFENVFALQKLHVADNLLNYTDADDMYKTVENLDWNTLNHSVFVNSTSLNEITNKTLIAPESLVWKEVSPTRYEAHIESNGPFMLVLLQSYSGQWKAYVDGNVIEEKNHLKVNGFANGWLIEDSGSLIITIEYETQNIFIASIIASVIAPASLLMFLSRKNIKKAAHTIKSKFKRKTD